jgi:hypothetical protein
MKKEVRLTMSHVDDGTLHAYLDGELSPVEVERLEAHVTGCPVCRARLDEERALIERASKLLGMAVPPGPERAAPPLHQLRQPRVIGRRLVIPLAWAATIVLALGLGYYAASMSNRRGPEESVAHLAPQESVASPQGVAVAPQSVTTAPDRGAERSTAQRQEPAAPRPRSTTPMVIVDGALADRAVREESDEAGQQSKAAAQLPAGRADVRLRGETAPAPAAGNVIIIDSNAQVYGEAIAASVPLSTTWPVIQPQPARDLLGGAPAMIPGYPVRALRRNPTAAREIVVEQELSPGVVVWLFEQPLDPGPAPLSRLDAQAPRDSLVAKARANERLARFVGRLRIEIAGPLPKDSLNRLLESIKP